MLKNCQVCFSWLDSSSGPRPPLWGPSIRLGRTPLVEWSAQRRGRYLTTLMRNRHPYPQRDSNRSPSNPVATGIGVKVCDTFEQTCANWKNMLISANMQSQCERVWTPSYRTSGCPGRSSFAHWRSCSPSEVSSLPFAMETSGPVEIVDDIISDKKWFIRRHRMNNTWFPKKFIS